MRGDKFRWRDLGLIGLGGILLLTDRAQKLGQSATEGTVHVTQEPVTERPDRGVQIDRLATRVGAFAVVAIAGSPVMRLAWLLWQAWQRDLPVVHNDWGWVILLMVFASMVAAVLFFFGLAVILTAIKMIGSPRTWWAIFGRGFVAVLGVYCLIATGTLIILQDNYAGPFNQLSDKLVLMSVCDQKDLTGYSCQDAMERCLENKAATVSNCQQYLEELRPTVGRNP